MKILFAGGGTGGHFYPLIAVARAIRKAAEEERIAKIEFFFMSDDPMDKNMLLEEEIKFIQIPAGKMRRYFSWQNIFDAFKTIHGVVRALGELYLLMPDVIFSKGGYSSFPVLFVARILRIPVVIHESDSIPGSVNRWAGRWASAIMVSFPESSRFFKNKRVIVTGNPVRLQVVGGTDVEAIQTFNLEENIPVILVVGGSQGSEPINEIILSLLPEMVKKYQIIHQTGENHYADVSGRAQVILTNSELKHRYHPYPFLKEGDYRNAGKIASLAVFRAGAGSIFEIAAWGIPAILIPLPHAAQDHQRENAYNYARAGGCVVLEEKNLKPHLLLSEIEKILIDSERIQKMKSAAENFYHPDAAEKIAREILKLGVHE